MKVLFLDAYNLIYRARSGFAMGDYPVIYNFFRQLRPLVEKFSPDKVYFVLEGNPKFRNQLSEGAYKSNRTSAGDEFHRQKAAIINIVSELFPFETVKHPELECDDTIATLACEHAKSGDAVTIISSDSDFIQLLNIKNYKKIRPVAIDTVTYLKSTTDDVVVISTAMLVGLLITKDPESLNTMLALNIFEIPDWCVLIFIPTCMATMSLIGIHPLITSTVLLSIYANSEIQINEALIMQAHLIGWCTGTMSSIASLSVISCSRLFKTKSSSLCFGQNTIMTLLFAFFGGSFLSLIDFLLKLWS